MPGWGGVGGWLETYNRAISVQLNLTRTATGTELGTISFCCCKQCMACMPSNIIELLETGIGTGASLIYKICEYYFSF